MLVQSYIVNVTKEGTDGRGYYRDFTFNCVLCESSSPALFILMTILIEGLLVLNNREIPVTVKCLSNAVFSQGI